VIPPFSIWAINHSGRWPGLDIKHQVNYAYTTGRLIARPCLICGASPTHAHHADHDKPLDVVFLCPKHHAQLHSRLRDQFQELKPQRYTSHFHNQVLSELSRAYRAPQSSITHLLEKLGPIPTIRRVAHFLDEDPATTWRRLASGQLKAVDSEGRARITLKSLAALLNGERDYTATHVRGKQPGENPRKGKAPAK
jgi:hypothetical protein